MNLLAIVALVVGAGADTAVVCPAPLRPALAPWIALREGQGHVVTLLTATGDAATLRDAIRKEASSRGLRYVLLVGDADPQSLESRAAIVSAAIAGAANSAAPDRAAASSRQPARTDAPFAAARPLADPRSTSWQIPTRRIAATVNVRFGSEPEIATDNWFADLDDDGSPDLAIGRLTADTAEELTTMVRKIAAYETNRDFGHWRREVHLVAGVGGFGPLIDSAVEIAAKSVIASGLPPTYDTVMTQASWASPYFPDPRTFQKKALAGLERGCLFWVYMGHGQRVSLDEGPAFAGRSAPILDTTAARRLAPAGGPSIACLFACYSGAFDGVDDCLAEELLRAPGGPVAVLCASRVTMPYGMSTLGMELIAQALVERRPTLGDAVLAAKRAVAAPESSTPLRKTLDMMAQLLSPAPVDLAGERAEHLAMFNLLGDPLLSLKHPLPISLAAPRRADAGETIVIEGVSPIAGAGVVEFVVRRDRLRGAAPLRARSPASAAEAARCDEAYYEANDPAWARKHVRLPAGRFSVKLTAPKEAEGPCHVRVFLAGLDDFAAGAADLEIVPPAATERPEPPR